MSIIQKVPTEQASANASHRQKAVRIKVVAGFDELHKALAIRAACFLGKPGWTYAHTFDSNDQTATHLLAEIDGEPVGTIRIRWFCDFARIERVAILPQSGNLAVLRGLAQKALRLCRSKGYRLATGLTYPRLVNFWRRQGGETCGDVIASAYGDVVPMLLRTDAITDVTPPDITKIGTPEFEWRTYQWEGAEI